MDVLEAIRARHMHRVFDQEQLRDEELLELVRAGTQAPMAGNVLLRHLIVVTDYRVIKSLREVTPGFAANPPAVIVICTDTSAAEEQMGRHGREISSFIDVGAAAENIALAATGLGIAVCFSRSCTDAALRAVLDLPARIRPDLLVGVGRGARHIGRRPRRAAPNVHLDRFGHTWHAWR